MLKLLHTRAELFSSQGLTVSEDRPIQFDLALFYQIQSNSKMLHQAGFLPSSLALYTVKCCYFQSSVRCLIFKFLFALFKIINGMWIVLIQIISAWFKLFAKTNFLNFSSLCMLTLCFTLLFLKKLWRHPPNFSPRRVGFSLKLKFELLLAHTNLGKTRGKGYFKGPF